MKGNQLTLNTLNLPSAAGDCPTPTQTAILFSSDGTPLYTDIYLKDWTRRPALVIRGGNMTCVPPSIWTPDADYNLVVQRNTAAHAFLYSADRADGQALLAWLNQAPWSNGRFAMLGWSGSGIVDYLAAPGAGTYLRGIQTNFATGDLLNYGLFNGGVLHRETADLNGYAEGTPWEDYVGLPIWDNYLITDGQAASAHVAGLHRGGWFDVFGQGTLDSFSRLEKAGNLNWRNRQKVVIGPWLHGGNGTTSVGQLTFPSATDPRLQEYNSKWQSGVFRDDWAAWDALPAVRVYHMGASPGTEWRTYATWPPSPAVEYPLYFASGGSLSSNILPSAGQVAFKSNPSNPCPTRGGTNNLISCVPDLRPDGTCGPWDQSPIEQNRTDLVKFTSLPGGAWIVGRIHADVWIQTTLPDVDVFVRMTDVYPNNGPSILMAQGIQRARYRNGAYPLPLDLNPPTLVRVDLGSTALAVPADHKVRAIVSAQAGPSLGSSLYPLYSINPQNGDEYIGAHPNMTGSITVLFGGIHASALYIPVPTLG